MELIKAQRLYGKRLVGNSIDTGIVIIISSPRLLSRAKTLLVESKLVEEVSINLLTFKLTVRVI